MEWTQHVRELRQWSQNGERAPHKPLRYTDVELELAQLPGEYGPPRRTSPAYPFHHLVNDGVGELRTHLGRAVRGPG